MVSISSNFFGISKPNKESAEVYAGRHLGWEYKLNEDNTLKTGPMWINRGAFNFSIKSKRAKLDVRGWNNYRKKLSVYLKKRKKKLKK